MKKLLAATEVFTPGDFPNYTYVERAEAGLEGRLRDALATPGEIISVSGPSKSGKTVLIEKVVGLDNLITATGAGISDAEGLWARVLDWMDAPESIATGSSRTSTTGGSVQISGKARLPLFGGVSGEGSGNHELARSTSESQQRVRRGMTQVVREVADSSYVILIDDYHYMPRDVQEDVARQIKEAARKGVKICTASVPHRSDDVVRGNPELRGRVRAIDVGYWDKADLAKIPKEGFRLLNTALSDATVEKFLAETSGSPQLMQAACLQTCFNHDLRETASKPQTLAPPEEQVGRILEETASRTDFGFLVRDMHSGAKTRGTERKEFSLSDGTRGDVYRAVLLALAKDPAMLRFPYNQLYKRIQQVCEDEVPQASSIYKACYQIAAIAKHRSQRERILEWDEETSLLDIVEPYFLFYLRWSSRLKKLGEGHPRRAAQLSLGPRV